MPTAPMFDTSKFDVSKAIMDRAGIAKILPHRDNLALIDGIVHLDTKDASVVGWKDVRADEFWASGHFPGNPILPGVVLVEACAQVSLVCYKLSVPEIAGRLVVFGGIDGVRFRGAVRPGDRVFLMARGHDISKRGTRSTTQAVVNGKLVYEGEIFAIAT